ncbi:MAG: alanyl-tRNA editing protein [Acidobacteriota bacterium]
MTDELFRTDAYLRSCEAEIGRATHDGIVLTRTVFYPEGGGQPGDHGTLELSDGRRLSVVDAKKLEDGSILHVVEGDVSSDLEGLAVEASIDWDRRHRLMRVHTLLHLLCAVVPEKVTGGAVRDNGSGRLDFDMPEPRFDKEEVDAELNRLVTEAHPTAARWITDEELESEPELVRTMSVRPPRGQGRVRLMEIEGVDLQACGGTHVANTGEIGPVRVAKVQKKGKMNRRFTLQLTEY